MAALVVVPVLTGCGASQDSGAAGGTTQLRIAVGGVDPSLSQLWIAEESGFFKQHNLDVKIDITGSSTVTAVASGQDDLGNLGLPAPLTLANQGRQTSVIYWELGNKSSGFMAARPGINSPKDCRTLVTQPQSTGVYGWAEAYKKGFGATFEHKVFSDTASIPASVASGQIDCTVVPYGQVATALADGKVHLIVDPRNNAALPENVRSVNYMDATFWGVTDVLKKKSDAVVGFLAAMQQALHVMRTSPPEQLATLLLKSNDWKTFNQSALTDLMRTQAFTFAPHDGQISPQDWTAALDFSKLAGLDFIDQTDKKWSYGTRVDMSYLDKAGT